MTTAGKPTRQGGNQASVGNQWRLPTLADVIDEDLPGVKTATMASIRFPSLGGTRCVLPSLISVAAFVASVAY